MLKEWLTLGACLLGVIQQDTQSRLAQRMCGPTGCGSRLVAEGRYTRGAFSGLWGSLSLEWDLVDGDIQARKGIPTGPQIDTLLSEGRVVGPLYAELLPVTLLACLEAGHWSNEKASKRIVVSCDQGPTLTLDLKNGVPAFMRIDAKEYPEGRTSLPIVVELRDYRATEGGGTMPHWLSFRVGTDETEMWLLSSIRVER
jgi:hypothetical protein